MQKYRVDQLQEFCKLIGVEMCNLELLDMALTHSSFAHEARKKVKPEHNERIEFLGDSVLSIIVSTYMFNNFPKLAEGKLTRLRAQLVCEGTLYEYAKKIRLGEFLLLGHGEELSGGRERASILADAFEAVLGAIYLDRGMDIAREYLLGLMTEEINYVCTHEVSGDYKTQLQEYLQKDGEVDLVYRVVGTSGPEHNKRFQTEVLLEGKSLGSGMGRTKKDSEQQAAKDAMEKLHIMKK